MKRNLLTQIKNEWRENVWLVVELAVVCLAIWFIGTILYLTTRGLMLPRGFDPENVYTASTSWIRDDSPNYNGSDSVDYYTDFREIVKRLRENPNVEAVAVAYSLPYNYNYSGVMISAFDYKDSVNYYGNCREGTPEIIDVFKIKSLTGATSAQLKEMLVKGELLISDNGEYEAQGRDPRELKGKRVILGRDSSKVYKIGDVVEKMRRNDYEDSFGGMVMLPLNESDAFGDLIIRIKPGRDVQFKEEFKNNPMLRKQRNVYLTNLRSLMDIREANQRSMDVQVRTEVIVMVFLLVTIFLGLLGSFWFRMQQRISEIAIRKVCGARKREIFARVISEGMILLAGAVIIVSACVWPFSGDVTDMIGEEWNVILFTELFAVVMVAVGIVLSLWYPAKKAMMVEPAVAVKTE